MPTTTYPAWLRPANRIIMTLQRLGLPIGTMRVLSVPGRKSGQLRSTPVSPLRVDGQRYVIAGVKDNQWARNIRAAGWGELAHGRRVERVRLTEVLDREPRVRVLRAFPTEVPHGVQFFVRMGLVDDPTPDGFEAAADRSAVFRIDPLDDRHNAPTPH